MRLAHTPPRKFERLQLRAVMRQAARELERGTYNGASPRKAAELLRRGLAIGDRRKKRRKRGN